MPVARPHPGTDVNTIVRAFCDVFSDCSLWNATPFDLMLVGSRNAPAADPGRSSPTPWQTPGLEARLREVGFERPEQIGATFVGDADYLRELTAPTPPLTDDFPQRLRAARRPSVAVRSRLRSRPCRDAHVSVDTRCVTRACRVQCVTADTVALAGGAHRAVPAVLR